MFSGAASTIGKETDGAFLVVTGICVLLFAVIIFFMLYFLFRYSRERNRNPADIEGHPAIEISLLSASVIIVLFMFYTGWGGYRELKAGAVPPGALTVKATARQWVWSFEYDNGKTSNVLTLPARTPVKVLLHSEDVIHSLYIPAFRIKQDVMPGAEKYVWFTPDTEGAYDIFCTEYCGVGHSAMITMATVVGAGKFNAWLEEKAGAAPPVPPAGAGGAAGAEKGKSVFEAKGCKACHTVDGSPLVGPTLKGVFGSKVRVATGGREREVVADEEYIRRSELEPGADIVSGFPPVMPPQKGLLSDDEIKSLIEYIKSLK